MEKVNYEHTGDVKIEAKSIGECILEQSWSINETFMSKKSLVLTTVGTDDVALRSRFTTVPAMAAADL